MAKLTGKGTTLQQTISSVLTNVAQVTDITLSGEASKDYDSTTLDQANPYESLDLTGYTSPGTVEFGLFFDPALAGHAAIVALLGDGSNPPATCVWKLKYSNSGPSSVTYMSAGIGLDQTVVMNDGLKGKVKMNRTGLPTRA